jgi:GST-like protein
VIELFTADTPNGKKITIMLEEVGCEFKVTKIELSKDEQFKPDFKKLSPFGKIPVITDHENGKSLFESGAILIYLGEKYNKFVANGTDGNNWSHAWSTSPISSL